MEQMRDESGTKKVTHRTWEYVIIGSVNNWPCKWPVIFIAERHCFERNLSSQTVPFIISEIKEEHYERTD